MNDHSRTAEPSFVQYRIVPEGYLARDAWVEVPMPNPAPRSPAAPTTPSTVLSGVSTGDSVASLAKSHAPVGSLPGILSQFTSNQGQLIPPQNEIMRRFSPKTPNTHHSRGQPPRSRSERRKPIQLHDGK